MSTLLVCINRTHSIKHIADGPTPPSSSIHHISTVACSACRHTIRARSAPPKPNHMQGIHCPHSCTALLAKPSLLHRHGKCQDHAASNDVRCTKLGLTLTCTTRAWLHVNRPNQHIRMSNCQGAMSGHIHMQTGVLGIQ